MEIKINLPNWTEERTIYIMAGIELVAYKVRGKGWKVKIERCNMCGDCCTKVKGHPFPTIDGKCIYLQKEPGKNQMWRCSLGIRRPFGCCVAVSQDNLRCTEKYEDYLF